MTNERREYALWMPAELVLTLMGNWRHYQFIALPFLERCADAEGKLFQLPADVRIEQATYSWERKAIGLALSHPTFPVVPDGMERPSLYYREITIQALPADRPTLESIDADEPIIVRHGVRDLP